MNAGDLGAPEKLSPEQDISEFDCGEPVLNEWLRRRARQNEPAGASRTYVICLGKRVVGYYSLAAGAVSHSQAPGRLRRNRPDPIPVMVLGRLAVDTAFQGQAISAGLLRDAVTRIVQAAEIAGIRGIEIHAISDRAKHFYEDRGFAGSSVDPMTVMITVAEAQRILGGPSRR